MAVLARCESRILTLLALMCFYKEVNSFFQCFTLYNAVYNPMFHQKLRSLETLRQFLADGLLDDSGPGKTHQRPGFRHDHIPQHGKAGGDAACGGVRKYGTVQKPGLPQLLDSGGGFGHLHQGHNTLLHPCPAGTAKNKHRQLILDGPFHGGGDLFPHRLPHAGHQKPGIADSQHNVFAEHLAAAHCHGLIQSGFFPGLGQLFLIALIV